LFFITNDKAKELVPDLVIEFYEKHINWFMNKPSSLKQKAQRRGSNLTTHINANRRKS
jgi:hypothetical protein